MKPCLHLFLFLLPFGAFGQWIVYDPTSNLQQILDEARNFAQYVQMVQNQVREIQELTDQLNEFKHYESLFGNPAQVVLPMVPALNADLQSLEPGRNLESLVAGVDGNEAFTNNDSGLYRTVGPRFLTPGGQSVLRPVDPYRRFAAIDAVANNYVVVADNAGRRRAALKAQIAQTTAQLQQATTDAQVQKLHAVLTSQEADLASTDDELNQAVASALVQDIQNRNDQQKQVQALTEVQNAEFAEAISNYTAKFLLLTVPPTFPSP